MSHEEKLREFWIYMGDNKIGEHDSVDTSPLIGTPNQIHVIEYSAYQALLEIIKTQREALEFYGDEKNQVHISEVVAQEDDCVGTFVVNEFNHTKDVNNFGFFQGLKARAALSKTDEALKKLGLGV